MATCPPLYVPAPACQPYGFGLFSVAQFPQAADPHFECGVQYEPDSCQRAFCWTDDCDPNTTPTDKVIPEGVPLVTASAFTVYAGFNCKIVGRTPQDIESRARTALELGEQRAVERAYWTGECGANPHLANPDCTVLNAVAGAPGALNIVSGLEALESYLGDNSPCSGVIHAPRGVEPLMARSHLLEGSSGTQKRTGLGTRVAFGGGYVVNTGPDGTVAPAGTAWLYATGEVAIWRGSVYVNPDSVRQALNRITNRVELIAERTYVVSHACVCAAVLISVSCEC
jgi:hypothetical protein